MPFITLYDPEGNSVEVVSDDKESLMRRGFTENGKGKPSPKPKAENKAEEPVKSGSKNTFVN